MRTHMQSRRVRTQDGPAPRSAGAAPSRAARSLALGNDVLRQFVQASASQALPAALRAEMEARFGQDFSAVRVHADADAGASAGALAARAYTMGTDIVFGAGQFAPGTQSGRELLAHELAHVVQQGRGGAAPAFGGDAALEGDARAAAQAVTAGGAAQVSASSGVGVARDGWAWDPATALDHLYTVVIHSPSIPASVREAVVALNEDARTGLTAAGVSEQQRDEIVAAVGKSAGPTILALTGALEPARPSAAPAPRPVSRQKPATLPPPREPGLQAPEGVPAGVSPIIYLGHSGRPAWAPEYLWTDKAGTLSILTPSEGIASWDRDGRRLGLRPPGEDQILRILRAEDELQRNGGLRFVEGRGALDEAAWKAYVQEQKTIAGGEAAARIDALAGGISAWDQTQGGFAYLASVPSHALGGRWFGEPRQILTDAQRDLGIALHEVDRVRTPTELAEALEHVRSAPSRGATGFYNFKEDVFVGGDRTITGIKVGAVVTTAVVAAPVLATAAGGGAAFSSLGLGTKLVVIGGTGLGTGLLTGTVGGALESAHRGASWENYERGFADYAPVGLTYGGGFAIGGAFGTTGVLRGALLDAGVSSIGGAADRALHGGDAGEVAQAGAQSFLIGGTTGGLGRWILPGVGLSGARFLPARIALDAGGFAGLAWAGGSDPGEIYRQALLGGALSFGGGLGSLRKPGTTGQPVGVPQGAGSSRSNLSVEPILDIPGFDTSAFRFPALPATVLPETHSPGKFLTYNLPEWLLRPASPAAAAAAETPFGKAAEGPITKLYKEAVTLPQNFPAYDAVRDAPFEMAFTREKIGGKWATVANQSFSGGEWISIKTVLDSSRATPEHITRIVGDAMNDMANKSGKKRDPVAIAPDMFWRVMDAQPDWALIHIRVPPGAAAQLAALQAAAHAAAKAQKLFAPGDIPPFRVVVDSW